MILSWSKSRIKVPVYILFFLLCPTHQFHILGPLSLKRTQNILRCLSFFLASVSLPPTFGVNSENVHRYEDLAKHNTERDTNKQVFAMKRIVFKMIEDNRGKSNKNAPNSIWRTVNIVWLHFKTEINTSTDSWSSIIKEIQTVLRTGYGTAELLM